MKDINRSEVISEMKPLKMMILIILVVLVIGGGFLYMNRNRLMLGGSGMDSDPLSKYISNFSEIPAGTLLIDYFEKQEGVLVQKSDGTETGGGYYEITLSAYTDTDIQLDVYKREHEGAEEYHKAYFVPLSLLNEAYKVIDQYAMKNWNRDKATGGMTGMYYVCKFHKNGEFIRVSSDQMPEDGPEAFAEIKALLLDGINDQ
jgi:hypothetical protein